jgi:hypothetical protein
LRLRGVLDYGYARQDTKLAPRVPISARLVADLLHTAGAERVMCVLSRVCVGVGVAGVLRPAAARWTCTRRRSKACFALVVCLSVWRLSTTRMQASSTCRWTT